MRILVVHNSYQLFGGTDRVVINESELLRESGDEVIPFEKHNDSIKSYSLAEKVRFFPNTVNHREHLAELKILVAKTKPEVAHVHNIYPLISPQVYAVLRGLGIPVVQSFHDHRLALLCPQGNAYRSGKVCDLCEGGNYLHGVMRRCVKQSFPISVAYALALANSRHMKAFAENVTFGIVFNDYMKEKLLRTGFPEAKIVQKHHFIKDTFGQPTYRREPYAVFMGAVSPHKGIMTLLRVFKDLEIPLSLKVIGDGECFDQARDYVRENRMERVQMLGFIKGDERLHLLKNAAFQVVPSEFWETFCMSAVESLACGVPVVGADLGAIPYLIQDGRNGVLFESGNEADLKARIEWMWNNPGRALEMGKEGRRQYEESFTSQRNYARLKEIYQMAIKANGAR